ncbi:hypothetical protein [Streptomyces sp. PTY087I2]|uniref:hypothetical protein n=1 Tax=Streptomyces sp. PTY087I2 TaxID=1819298 RepID=UPI00099F85F0|nr:hypothetical protein [Streptomyces sp. PTY087I2]
MLATLLLAVLTLVGGAATANGAVPAALAARSLAPAVTTAAAPPPAAPPPAAPSSAVPQTHRTGHRAGHDSVRASRHDTCHDGVFGPRDHHAGHGIAHDIAHDTAHNVRHLVAWAGHEQPRAAADPAQAPRAGTGRAYLLLHAPPPPHDALTPAPPGPAEPRGGVQCVAAESFDAPGSRRGALPGVRGPPDRTTGPTTGHSPSCSARSAVPASRPR